MATAPSEDEDEGSLDLPERFLLHFGQLGPRKGTDRVAKALDDALAIEPRIKMVWAGAESSRGCLDRYASSFGPRGPVQWIGAVPRSVLAGVIRLAAASVLPSRVDNLPNTVLESLSHRVPVIGSLGASIDEVIEDGRNGRLVPMGDSEALTQAMIEAWRGSAAWTAGHDFEPIGGRAFESGVAVAGLLRLSGVTS